MIAEEAIELFERGCPLLALRVPEGDAQVFVRGALVKLDPVDWSRGMRDPSEHRQDECQDQTAEIRWAELRWERD